MRAGRVTAALVAAVSVLAAAGCSPIAPPPTTGGGLGPTPLATTPQPTSAGSPIVPPPSAGPGSAPPSSGDAAAPVPTTGSWARVGVPGERPPAREDHTWTVDETGTIAYLFGGRDGARAYDDLWVYELATGVWRRSGSIEPDVAPEARFGHEAQWVPGLGLVIFGGQAGPTTFFNDVWHFSPGVNVWRPLSSDAAAQPVARYGSCSGVGADGKLWISHGFTEDGARFSDTRSFDLGQKRWANESPTAGPIPVERCLHTCWWTADGRFTLYGGQTTGVPALGDLWRLAPGGGGASTNAWTEMPPPAPAARQLPAVARGGAWTLVVGGAGIDRNPLGDAWVLADNADAFVELALDDGDAPSARSGSALIHDAAHDRFLLFGGIDDEARDDLWSLLTN